MSLPDLSLLPALDALLTEASVVRAARKVGLSPSAMSRTLGRLRAVSDDPLLVRAGRDLVTTPRGADLRPKVAALIDDARSLLRPASDSLDVATLDTTFTLRAGEWFMDGHAPRLVADVLRLAPGVRLRSVPKVDKDLRLLRDGRVDLEIGAHGEWAPEVKTRLLYRDRFVGVARAGHPFLADPLTPQRFAACRHVMSSHGSLFEDAVDLALAELGLSRRVSAFVPGYPAAAHVARATDLLAALPRSAVVPPSGASPALAIFELPFATPEITISALWHPRLDADLPHRWLRSRIFALFQPV